MSVQLLFLGTGTSVGVPMVACTCAVCRSDDPRDKRLRSSVLIRTQEKTFLIDTGPDMRYQMLRSGTTNIDAVLLTHQHRDHLSGLDEVRAFNFMCRKRIPVYATSVVQHAIRREFTYIFETPDYPGIPQIDLHTIDDKAFVAEGVPVIPVRVSHAEMTVHGFRFGNLAYITDASHIDDSQKEKLQGLDVLVVNALRHEPHHSHFSLSQAIALAAELKPKQTWFTHISHQLGLHRLVSDELPPGIALAYDGLEVSAS